MSQLELYSEVSPGILTAARLPLLPAAYFEPPLDIIETDEFSTLYVVHGTNVRHNNRLPSILRNGGTKMWFCGGRLSRKYQPAVIYPNGSEEYWLYGEYVRSIYK